MPRHAASTSRIRTVRARRRVGCSARSRRSRRSLPTRSQEITARRRSRAATLEARSVARLQLTHQNHPPGCVSTHEKGTVDPIAKPVDPVSCSRPPSAGRPSLRNDKSTASLSAREPGIPTVTRMSRSDRPRPAGRLIEHGGRFITFRSFRGRCRPVATRVGPQGISRTAHESNLGIRSAPRSHPPSTARGRITDRGLVFNQLDIGNHGSAPVGPRNPVHHCQDRLTEPGQHDHVADLRRGSRTRCSSTSQSSRRYPWDSHRPIPAPLA